MSSTDISEHKKTTSIALSDGTKEVFTMCDYCTKALTTEAPKVDNKNIYIYNPFKKRYVIPAKYFIAPEIREERCHGCGSYWREIEESDMDDSNRS